MSNVESFILATDTKGRNCWHTPVKPYSNDVDFGIWPGKLKRYSCPVDNHSDFTLNI